MLFFLFSYNGYDDNKEDDDGIFVCESGQARTAGQSNPILTRGLLACMSLYADDGDYVYHANHDYIFMLLAMHGTAGQFNPFLTRPEASELVCMNPLLLWPCIGDDDDGNCKI